MTQQQPSKIEDPTDGNPSSSQTVKEMDVDLGYAEETLAGDQRSSAPKAVDAQAPTNAPAPEDDGDFILTLSEVVEEEEELAHHNESEPSDAVPPHVESSRSPEPQAASSQASAPDYTSNESAQANTKAAAASTPIEPSAKQEPLTKPNALATPEPEASPAAQNEKGANPFLPKHIIDKLDQGRKDLEDDILQSSAALDVSTALLRTHARAEQMSSTRTNNNPFAAKDRVSQQKQKLVDEIVDEYLPLLASEMRRRLHKMLDDQ